MRIIAGTLKGRRLESPTWAGLRPTSDKLRETLFNILAPRVSGARVLDAFAGTGAVGIEALSRGAAHVTFVDVDRRALALVAANLRRCGVTDRYAIIRTRLGDDASALPGGAFDLAVLDPPYDADLVAPLHAIAPLMMPGGLVVLEHARRHHAPEGIPGMVRMRVLTSGDSALTVYRAVSDQL
jgi:16S rRNA (guanine(966)-N(2))-methyltransferase RsmD